MIEFIQTIIAKVSLFASLYLGKIILSIIIFFVGRFVINWLLEKLDVLFKNRKIDVSLARFSHSALNAVLYIILIINIAVLLGFNMAAFVTILGAAGLAVGLALQGSLSNLAGGVLILIFRPFNVGDYIEAHGHAGIVKDIQILYTVIDTLDNRRVVIPNSDVSNSSMTNYTAYDTRRVDLTFGVGYGTKIEEVKAAVQKVIEANSKIMKDPAPFVRLQEHGGSSLNYVVRVWCKTADYWDVFFDMQEEVKREFDAKGIEIPFPQMDVHMIK